MNDQDLTNRIAAKLAKPGEQVQPLLSQFYATVNEQAASLPMELGSIMIDRGLSSHSSAPQSIGYVELSGKTVPKKILELIPEHIARHYQIVPIAFSDDGTLSVAMIDPEDQEALEVVKKRTGYTIKRNLTTVNDINYVLSQYSNVQSELAKFEVVDTSEEEKEATKQQNIDLSENSPAAQIVQKLLLKAAQEKTSDIHFEPMEKELVIRFRKDGMLKKMISLPKEIQPGVLTRIKILSNMRLDEQRLPQDGRFQIAIGANKVDLRVSSLPTVNGEKIVMRILSKEQGLYSMEQIGIEPTSLAILKDNLTKSHGMLLVTGPTGSGKSTTLYAMLGEIMDEKVNIITLEDPVEYRIDTVNQAQVNVDIGFSFAKGLRSILRQDPDVIMVGEIRDDETASIAIHSALTGHLVFSTLHTNSAAGAIPRMIDMGIEPFLISSSLNAIMAQRLARKICKNCAAPANINPDAVNLINEEVQKLPQAYRDKLPQQLNFLSGRGCDQCANTGYSGRIGLYEVLDINEEIIQAITKNTSTDQISDIATKRGMLTLKQDGILKAIQGITTIEEIWRVTKE